MTGVTGEHLRAVLTGKMDEAVGQGMQAPLGAGRRKDMDSRRLRRRNAACCPWTAAPTPTLELGDSSCCFKPLSCWQFITTLTESECPRQGLLAPEAIEMWL